MYKMKKQNLSFSANPSTTGHKSFIKMEDVRSNLCFNTPTRSPIVIRSSYSKLAATPNKRLSDFHRSRQDPAVLDEMLDGSVQYSDIYKYSTTSDSKKLGMGSPQVNSTLTGIRNPTPSVWHRNISPVLMKDSQSTSNSTSLVQLAASKRNIPIRPRSNHIGTTYISPVLVKMACPSKTGHDDTDVMDSTETPADPCDKDVVVSALKEKRKRWWSSVSNTPAVNGGVSTQSIDYPISKKPRVGPLSPLVINGGSSGNREFEGASGSGVSANKRPLPSEQPPQPSKKVKHTAGASYQQRSRHLKRLTLPDTDLEVSPVPSPALLNRKRNKDIDNITDDDETDEDTTNTEARKKMKSSTPPHEPTPDNDTEIKLKREATLKLESLSRVFPLPADRADSREHVRKKFPIFCATGSIPHVFTKSSPNNESVTREVVEMDRKALCDKVKSVLTSDDPVSTDKNVPISRTNTSALSTPSIATTTSLLTTPSVLLTTPLQLPNPKPVSSALGHSSALSAVIKPPNTLSTSSSLGVSSSVLSTSVQQPISFPSLVSSNNGSVITQATATTGSLSSHAVSAPLPSLGPLSSVAPTLVTATISNPIPYSGNSSSQSPSIPRLDTIKVPSLSLGAPSLGLNVLPQPTLSLGSTSSSQNATGGLTLGNAGGLTSQGTTGGLTLGNAGGLTSQSATGGLTLGNAGGLTSQSATGGLTLGNAGGLTSQSATGGLTLGNTGGLTSQSATGGLTLGNAGGLTSQSATGGLTLGNTGGLTSQSATGGLTLGNAGGLTSQGTTGGLTLGNAGGLTSQSATAGLTLGNAGGLTSQGTTGFSSQSRGLFGLTTQTVTSSSHQPVLSGLNSQHTVSSAQVPSFNLQQQTPSSGTAAQTSFFSQSKSPLGGDTMQTDTVNTLPQTNLFNATTSKPSFNFGSINQPASLSNPVTTTTAANSFNFGLGTKTSSFGFSSNIGGGANQQPSIGGGATLGLQKPSIGGGATLGLQQPSIGGGATLGLQQPSLGGGANQGGLGSSGFKFTLPVSSSQQQQSGSSSIFGAANQQANSNTTTLNTTNSNVGFVFGKGEQKTNQFQLPSASGASTSSALSGGLGFGANSNQTQSSLFGGLGAKQSLGSGSIGGTKGTSSAATFNFGQSNPTLATSAPTFNFGMGQTASTSASSLPSSNTTKPTFNFGQQQQSSLGQSAPFSFGGQATNNPVFGTGLGNQNTPAGTSGMFGNNPAQPQQATPFQMQPSFNFAAGTTGTTGGNRGFSTGSKPRSISQGRRRNKK